MIHASHHVQHRKQASVHRCIRLRRCFWWCAHRTGWNCTKTEEETKCDKDRVQVAPNATQGIQFVSNFAPIESIANTAEKCEDGALQIEEIILQESQTFFAYIFKTVRIFVGDVREHNGKYIPRKTKKTIRFLVCAVTLETYTAPECAT